MRLTSVCACFFSLFIGVQSITIGDVYRRLIEKERNIDKTFTYQFIKPIGTVAGEFIWPRSYDFPSELFFDENGASFNVRPRASLHSILMRHHLGTTSSQGYGAYDAYRV